MSLEEIRDVRPSAYLLSSPLFTLNLVNVLLPEPSLTYRASICLLSSRINGPSTPVRPSLVPD
jgi:hypothetical protein